MVDLVFEVLGALREEGVTVLLVEQNAARAVELRRPDLRPRARADRRSAGTRDELRATRELETAYLGV